MQYTDSKAHRTDRMKIQPFPTATLPSWVGDMVDSICDARNVPPEIAGPTALGALSSSIGRNLLGKDIIGDGILPANTFILVGADTGQGKSRATEPLMQPILDVEESLEREWVHKSFQLSDEKEALEAQLKQLRFDQESEADPQAIKWRIREIDAELARGCPRLTCEKTTLAYFRDALAANDCVMTFFSDDGRAFIHSVLKSEENITLLLKGYSLGNYSMGKFKQETRLKHICLNLLILCQPDFVANLFKQGPVSGLLGRFFVCDYLGDLRSRSLKAPRIDPKVQERYHQRLTAMVRGIRMATSPLYVSGSTDSDEVLWSYGHSNVKLANQSAVRINELVPRREEKAARLALNLHAAVWGPEAGEHRLTERCIIQE